jgi:hypothetical protein
MAAVAIGLACASPSVGQNFAVNGGGKAVPDYDELVALPAAFNSLGQTTLPGSRSGDAVNVVWLAGDTDKTEGAGEYYQFALAADPLQNRDIYTGGVFGDTLSRYPTESFDNGLMTLGGGAIYRREWPESFGIIYGLRALDELDQLTIFADGAVLGRASWATRAKNRILGPQAGFIWLSSRGPWALRLHGTALAGLNSGRVDQVGEIGEDIVASRLNHPLYFRPTQFLHSESNGRFSPSAELVAQISARLTENSAIRVGWTGVVIDNALIAWDRVLLRLPEMGLRDPGNQSIVVHDVYCGFEWVR